MPELPEVETTVRALNSSPIIGMKIKYFECRWANCLTGANHNDIQHSIQGTEILSIQRRGKNIVFNLSSDTHLVFHLKMSGRFLIKSPNEPINKHEQILLTLENHSQKLSLRFHDPRKFGRCHFVHSLDDFFKKLGIEPFDQVFSPAFLSHLVKDKKGKLKCFLLNQEFIAGLGNIYVDECLWLSSLSPLKAPRQLNVHEISRLFEAIQTVLIKGIEQGGTSLGAGTSNFHHVNGESGKNQNDLNVYGKTGLPCKRCGNKIIKLIVAARGTHICPTCQS